MEHIKNVVEWLDASAERSPDKIAFSDGNVSLTFAELRDETKRIASELARHGIFKKPVLVRMDKVPQAVAAFLGCARSGNFYAPLDVDTSAERLAAIRDAIKPAAEITGENYSSFACAGIDDGLLTVTAERQTAQDLLYILFTSGSTGVPKAVAVSHRGMIETSLAVREVFGFDESTVHGHGVQIYNSSSYLPIYQTLLCGGSDYLIPKSSMMFAPKIVDFLNVHKCNSIFWVSTSYAVIAKSGIFKKRRPEYLKTCMFTGATMQTAVLNEWRRVIPDAVYANMMGLTESAGSYLCYIVDREFSDAEPLPIGRPFKNVDVLLLNERNEPCRPGETGELCIRSEKLSCGYYNAPQKTAEFFVQNPLNSAYPETVFRTGDLGYVNVRGEYMHAGRKDFQIKHMGYRIDPGEIECAADRVEGVQMSACFYDEGAMKIVLAYCGEADREYVRAELKKLLPPYMMPARFIRIAEMPLIASGKIDRRRLMREYAAMPAEPRRTAGN